jgi:hypothetical protein
MDPYQLAPLVTDADNLTASLEWCRQQGRYDLCARIAVRMMNYWVVFFRLGEMLAWWRDLDAGLPVEDRDHRAMALLLRTRAALVLRDWNEVKVYSAQVCALADPHSWLAMEAINLQAVYWLVIDTPKADPLFERLFEIRRSMGLSLEPFYAPFYISRLLRANGSEEALAVLGDWLAHLGDSVPTRDMAAMFALYGDTRTALEVKSRIAPARTPMARAAAAFSEAVLESAQGLFDEAEQHIATLYAMVRDFAAPRAGVPCLIGFANIALDRGDYARASRLLASVNASIGPEDEALPFGTLTDLVVYDHCARVLRDALDPESARATQAEGAALSVKEALDAELSRSGTANVANPAD